MGFTSLPVVPRRGIFTHTEIHFVLKDEIEKAEIKRDQDAKAARDNAEAREIMKNITNKEDK